MLERCELRSKPIIRCNKVVPNTTPVMNLFHVLNADVADDDKAGDIDLWRS